MGKTGRKNKKYSPEFKIRVIMDMREHRLGYREVMRKYFPYLKENCFDFIKQWERIFLEEGAEGLMKERRGKTILAESVVAHPSSTKRSKKILLLRTKDCEWR